MVKTSYGLSDFPGTRCNVYEGHVVAGYVELRCRSPFFVYSVYGICGIGMEGRNIDIMQALARYVLGHGRPFGIGGDFNIPPGDMQDSVWLRKLHGVIVTGHTRYTTVTAGKAGRRIDYFIIHKELADTGT